MTDGYVYIMGHKSHINLGFFHGIDLPDPQGMLQGTGKKLRHIKLASLDDAKRPEVRSLAKAAFDHVSAMKSP
jgi:Domain of unknown function (DU1801)